MESIERFLKEPTFVIGPVRITTGRADDRHLFTREVVLQKAFFRLPCFSLHCCSAAKLHRKLRELACKTGAKRLDFDLTQYP